MSSIILKFLSSKLGISSVAIVLVLLVGGVQQLRINSYQDDVRTLEREKGALKLTVKLKETEALDLEASIIKQNNRFNQLQIDAAADKKERESNLLKLQFKHKQEIEKLNEGKGPEDLNRWFIKHLK